MADFRDAYLKDLVYTYRNYRSLADRALAQLHHDADFHAVIGPGSNSIAIIMQHVAGNLRSRFRDFLTTDGEKPDRNRDGEFEMPTALTRDQMLDWWREGWTIAMQAIESLTPGDLERTVYIRGKGMTVVEALNRSATHTAYHVGQIVYLVRHLTWPGWTPLTIPKGKSGQATH
ncbi:MAG: DUF1572 family protein [Acidobacteriota bacterium]